MTIAEIDRLIESKERVYKAEQKQRANYDYILGDLIGRSIGRLYNSNNTYPEIHQMYPDLFDAKEAEEQKRARQNELSALRFKQFANAHNKKFEGGK